MTRTRVGHRRNESRFIFSAQRYFSARSVRVSLEPSPHECILHSQPIPFSSFNIHATQLTPLFHLSIMSAANYYDSAASQEQTSHFSPTSGQQPGPMHSGTQGYSQELRDGMHEQQHSNLPQQGYSGQEPQMGSSNYAQGAQQMNGNNNNNYEQGAQQMEGHGAQGAVADDRDTITKCNDNPPDYKKRNSKTVPLMNKCFITLSNDAPARAALVLTAAVQLSLI